jgi:Fibronectin type III-like domain
MCNTSCTVSLVVAQPVGLDEEMPPEADIHKGYLDMPSTPLFPFGHGLSYTTFEYGPLELVSDTVDVGGEVRASVTVSNTGDRAGTEIVQLYAAGTATGVTLPAQQLVGFARVDLEPGESKTVEFALPLSVLAYTGIAGEVVMEPGPIELTQAAARTTSARRRRSPSPARCASSTPKSARSSRSRRSARSDRGMRRPGVPRR